MLFVFLLLICTHIDLGSMVHFRYFNAPFQKNITSMSRMLFLMFVQSMFQFGAKGSKWERFYGEKNYLDMSFVRLSFIMPHSSRLSSRFNSATYIKATEVHTTNPFLFYRSIVYSFPLVQKRIQSWSQGIQKNRKYKLTTTLTNEEI